jgi:hypothetical protein
MMSFPVQLAGRVSLGLNGRKDAVPEASVLPAVEPCGHAGGRSIARGQVGPGSAGAQDPQNAVDHGAVVVAWTTTLASFGGAARWEQRLDARPLAVSQVSSMHSGSIPKGLRIRPSESFVVRWTGMNQRDRRARPAGKRADEVMEVDDGHFA